LAHPRDRAETLIQAKRGLPCRRNNVFRHGIFAALPESNAFMPRSTAGYLMPLIGSLFGGLMQSELTQKIGADLEELNEKQRREMMKNLEQYGKAGLADLGGMSDIERTKWLFWNMHENLDELRTLEPALIGQLIRTQLTVSDGQSMWTDRCGLEKRVELHCKWQLLLRGDTFQKEDTFPLSAGWIDLYIAGGPPPHPVLQEKQKGYLDADSGLYPNQIFLYGWITEGVWQEIKPQLYNASSNCHTDIFLRDDFLFPVKAGHGFVTGPVGSIGITNFEFRTSSHPRLNTWVQP
jgi:hypothetical protein